MCSISKRPPWNDKDKPRCQALKLVALVLSARFGFVGWMNGRMQCGGFFVWRLPSMDCADGRIEMCTRKGGGRGDLLDSWALG